MTRKRTKGVAADEVPDVPDEGGGPGEVRDQPEFGLAQEAGMAAEEGGPDPEAWRHGEFGREAMVGFCAAVLRARPSEASLENPLCELRMSAKGPYALFPAKKDMLDRLAKLLGLDQEKGRKAEADAAAVEEMLREAFAELALEPALPEDGAGWGDEEDGVSSDQ